MKIDMEMKVNLKMMLRVILILKLLMGKMREKVNQNSPSTVHENDLNVMYCITMCIVFFLPSIDTCATCIIVNTLLVNVFLYIFQNVSEYVH